MLPAASTGDEGSRDEQADTGAVLFVFARAPVAGQVKTRLAAHVGREAAVALHAAFVEDVCRSTRGLAARRVLAVAGDPASFAVLAGRHGLELATQAEGDLGARLDAAVRDGLGAGAARAVVIGGDAPLLPPARIAEALDLLRTTDVVLGPAEDGGYYLVGARCLVPWLFAGIPWGTAAVLAASEERLRERGVHHRLLRRFWDVDEPADLERLRVALRADPALAPATQAVLARLGRHGLGTDDS